MAAYLDLAFTALLMLAPERPPDGGGPYRPARTSCLDEAQRQRIREEVNRSIEALIREGVLKESGPTSVPLSWPLRAAASLPDPGYHGISNFVDQNPSFPNALLDYNCGARTYDLASGYNHAGIDFFTWPFGWLKMDTSAVEIVAAAPGTIVLKSDGNFDRQCGFGGGNWNAVYVRHADNSVAWYGHMKNGSLTSKPVGATVVAGEFLGVVGSSGNSTGPHLHFELYDGASQLNEPYGGPCNSMNAFSWWTAQRPYYDSAVNAIHTNSAAPAFNTCPQQETPNIATLFSPGQTAYFVTYYRDQRSGQQTAYSIRRPDGTLFDSWSHSSPAAFYAASYWYWFQPLPTGPQGTWRFRADYQGAAYETLFSLGVPGPVVNAVTPNQGSAVGGTPVTILGLNFQAGASVTFGGQPATAVTVVNPQTITATTPAHAEGSVDVAVTNPAPAVSGGLPAGFFYTPAPTATRLYTMSGCRVLDTRQPGGPTAGQPLGPNTQNTFIVAGAPCGVPATAKAVLFNATVVAPSQAGHVRLYPGNSPAPLASTLNYRALETRANSAIVPLSTDATGRIGILNGSAGTIHLVLDVNGYFQ
jgi:murein DD-endopeptidase MepM/ murein hydrolase activator NlpD